MSEVSERDLVELRKLTSFHQFFLGRLPVSSQVGRFLIAFEGGYDDMIAHVHLDVGHSKGWHLGHGDQGYHLQVKEHVNIGNIESTF